MSTVTRAGPSDLIALVWFRLGYRPQESIVVVGLDGPRRQAGLITRLDVPRNQHAAHARGLGELLQRSGAQAAVAMVISERADLHPAAGRPPAVRALQRELPRAGVEVMDVLWLRRGCFGSYLCRDAACCPPDGRPQSEAMSSRAAAELVMTGAVIADGEADLVRDVLPAADDATDVAGPGPALPPDPAGWLGLWRAGLAAGVLESGLAAPLAIAMDDVRLRDAIMVTFLPGAGGVPEALLAGEAGQLTFERSYDRLVATRPDDDLLCAATRLLAASARLAPAGARAPVLSCLAWVSWWAGHCTRARLLAELALRDRPGYSLATLVDQALRTGVPPPWVQHGSLDALGPES